MFKEESKNNTLLITRKENENVKKHPWTYSINLDNKEIADNAKEFLKNFIEKYVDLDVTQLENGHLVSDWIYMEDYMHIKKIKIFNLLEWLDKETNYVQDNFIGF